VHGATQKDTAVITVIKRLNALMERLCLGLTS
jgi:hypothetical protein